MSKKIGFDKIRLVVFQVGKCKKTENSDWRFDKAWRFYDRRSSKGGRIEDQRMFGRALEYYCQHWRIWKQIWLSQLQQTSNIKKQDWKRKINAEGTWWVWILPQMYYLSVSSKSSERKCLHLFMRSGSSFLQGLHPNSGLMSK